MTIREATPADAAEIFRMGERFLSADGPYFGRFKSSPGSLERLLARMLQPGALALVLEAAPGRLVGMLGAFVFAHPITAQIVASELCWWVDPESRGSRMAGRLIDRAIAWATVEGAEWFEMIAPNDRIGAFYERIGFERSDTHFVKVLR